MMARYEDVKREFEAVRNEITDNHEHLTMYQDKFNDFVNKTIEENYSNLTRIGAIESIRDSIQFYTDEIVTLLLKARTLAALQ